MCLTFSHDRMVITMLCRPVVEKPTRIRSRRDEKKICYQKHFEILVSNAFQMRNALAGHGILDFKYCPSPGIRITEQTVDMSVPKPPSDFRVSGNILVGDADACRPRFTNQKYTLWISTRIKT